MKSYTNYTLIGLCFVELSGPLSGRAATVWTGPTMTFTKVGFADPTLSQNQDRMAANVWLTRANTEGLYNAKQESGYDKINRTSPLDTEWAYGTTANYASLTYANWYTWSAAFPPGTVGMNAVVHLISEDIYVDIKFTAWGGSTSGGAFSYMRSTPTNLPPTVTIDSPTNGASFNPPATIAISATANDPDGNVTNVLFFDGVTFLGQTNNTPYTVSATFGTGTHALTAVASDNAGLSTTSSVVNIFVGAVNPTLSVTITNPPDNSVFGNTDSVLIGANVSDTNGVVTNASFFDGAVLLRSLSASPFSFSTGPFTFALGLHTLTAVARDDIGAMATSAPVHLTIARYTPEVTIGAF